MSHNGYLESIFCKLIIIFVFRSVFSELFWLGTYCDCNDSDTERALVEELASLKASRKAPSVSSNNSGNGLFF